MQCYDGLIHTHKYNVVLQPQGGAQRRSHKPTHTPHTHGDRTDSMTSIADTRGTPSRENHQDGLL